MDQLSVIVCRARKIAGELPRTHPTAAYGASTFWNAVYLAVLEVSDFELVVPGDGDRDMSAHLEFRSHGSDDLRDLILLIQKYIPDFCPTSEDRPQVLRRQIATAIVDLANPRLPLDA